MIMMLFDLTPNLVHMVCGSALKITQFGQGSGTQLGLISLSSPLDQMFNILIWEYSIFWLSGHFVTSDSWDDQNCLVGQKNHFATVGFPNFIFPLIAGSTNGWIFALRRILYFQSEFHALPAEFHALPRCVCWGGGVTNEEDELHIAETASPSCQNSMVHVQYIAKALLTIAT